MKKIFMIIVCASTFVVAKAQVSYGIKGGLNLSNIIGSDAEGAKAKIGFHAGAFSEIPVTDKFSIQPELVYSAQGAKYEESGEDAVKINSGFLNIPVLAKYTAASGFYGETGPQLGFLMSAKAKQGDDKTDVKEFYKTTDFAWAFGIGYKTSSNVGVDLRYNLGLSRLDEDGDAKVKNGVFQLGIFYVLGNK
jgi:opacity protein-like surface antigen